jgi:cytochrome bd-type quinol oxidase subunit 2
LGQHLRALAAAHEELGAPPDEAARAAVRRFGDPARIACAFLQTWQRTPGHVTARHFYKHALAAFAGLMLFNLVSATYLINLPPEQQRQMLPLFWPAFMIAWVIIGGPLLAGWHLGRRAPERKAARAIAGALATLCVRFGRGGAAAVANGRVWPNMATPAQQLHRAGRVQPGLDSAGQCVGLGVVSSSSSP